MSRINFGCPIPAIRKSSRAARRTTRLRATSTFSFSRMKLCAPNFCGASCHSPWSTWASSQAGIISTTLPSTRPARSSSLTEAIKDSPYSPELSKLQKVTPTPWDSARHDSFTFEMALQYLKAVKPRALVISFDETDDWAHNHRYDMVLESHLELRRIPPATASGPRFQSMPEYRDPDNIDRRLRSRARGSTLADWSDHGRNVKGAEKIWIAVMGPDTPASGEVAAHAEQRDIAPTIVELMGLNPQDYKGATGKPIESSLFGPVTARPLPRSVS